MKCEKFEQLWNEALDARQHPEDQPELSAHAQSCSACAELLLAGDALWDALETLPQPLPSDDLEERVLNEVRRQPRPVLRAALMFTALATAAAVLFVVGTKFALPQPDQPGIQLPGVQDDHLVSHPPVEIRPAEGFTEKELILPEADFPNVSPLVAVLPTDGEYLAMLRQTGAAMALFPDRVRRAARAEDANMLVDGIRPLAQPMSAAFEALRRTLPGQDEALPTMMDENTKS